MGKKKKSIPSRIIRLLTPNPAAPPTAPQERGLIDGHKAHSFFELSLDMLCIVGPDGHFKVLNEAWAAELGFSHEELKAKPFIEFVHPEDRETTGKAWEALFSGKEVRDFTNRYINREGHTRWLSWNARESDGLVYASARNITEIKNMERMKDEFVSTVSHELRTPITSIRGALGLIGGGAVGPIPEPMAKLISVASKNCERLLLLINDILDVERIETGNLKFHMQPIHVGEVVRATVEANEGLATQYGVTFGLSLAPNVDEVTVMADSDRLTQVVSNFLSNAAKFSPKNSRVEVGVTRKNGRVRVAVTDLGPGIPPEFRPRVFDKFAQADSSDTKSKAGTGLGLAISKSIVTRLRGKIHFDTEVGRGTTFYVELPEVGSDEMPLITPVSGLRRRMLLLEKDEKIASTIRSFLQRHGAIVEVAQDIAQADLKVRKHTFDAFLLSINSVGHEGIAWIRRLRWPDRDRNAPTVFYGAEWDKDTFYGDACSVLDWLEKPVEQDLLLSAVERITHTSPARKPHILYVEDEVLVAEILCDIMEDMAKVTVQTAFKDAARTLESSSFDALMVDIGLPDGNGLDLFPILRKQARPIPVLVFSGQGLDDTQSARLVRNFRKSRQEQAVLLELIREMVFPVVTVATPALPKEAALTMEALNRILVVEDEPDIQMIARMSLETVGGFTVAICSSGPEALTQGPDFGPQLILLDFMMPGMDGAETLKELKKHPVLSGIPVIFLTAKIQPNEVNKFIALGALDVISKPFDPMALPQAVKALWEKWSQAHAA